jgi:hypothetical protein
MDRDFKIVYNSDLIIRNPQDAATLCLFYDKVLLPYTTEDTRTSLLGRSVFRADNVDKVKEWEIEYGRLTLPSECVSLSLPVSREIFILVVVVVAVKMWESVLSISIFSPPALPVLPLVRRQFASWTPASCFHTARG